MDETRIESLNASIKEIKLKTDLQDQQFLSLRSIENYLIYFKDLKRYKNEVFCLLHDYLEIIKKKDCHFSKDECRNLGIEFIMKIGYYYNVEVGFKLRMQLSFAIFWGLLVDVLLLVLQVLKVFHYLPIITFLLLLYWLYLKVLETKNKIYDIGY